MRAGNLEIGDCTNTGKPVHLPVNVLLKNCAVLGSVGSGKTVAAKVIIEEAAANGVPSIIVDPHGDIAKMALPNSISNLEQHDIDVNQAMKFHESVEFRLWTPASDIGLRLCLSPFASAPKVEDYSTISDRDPVILEALDRMASGFTSVSGFATGRKEGPIKAFLNQLLFCSMRAGSLPVSFKELSEMVLDAQDYLTRWGFEDKIEELTVGLLSEGDRVELSRGLRALSTGLTRVLFEEGVPLDIETMVTPSRAGKTPINIILINSLIDEQARQSFISEVCRTIFSWGRNRSNDTNNSDLPNLLCVFDEVHQFLPPHPKNPAAKSPLLALYKEGRKYGIGCLLASQQMTDVDYKALGNVNTGFFGRVTDPRERKSIQPHLSHLGDANSFLDNIANSKPGEFLTLCRDFSTRPIMVRFRWLYGQHGSPITNDEIKNVHSAEVINWANSIGSSVLDRVSQFRNKHPSENSVIEVNLKEALIADAQTDMPKIEGHDSVYAGDINQKSIHGIENLTIFFNPSKNVDEEEITGIEESLSKAYQRSTTSQSTSMIEFRDLIVDKLEHEINTSEERLEEKLESLRNSARNLYPKPKKSKLFLSTISSLLLSLILFLFGSVGLSLAYENKGGFTSFGDNVMLVLFVFFLLFYCFSFVFGLRDRTVHYSRAVVGYISQLKAANQERNTKIKKEIEGFLISVQYSNLYHQTNLAEYEVVALIPNFQHVLLKRRVISTGPNHAKTSLEWIEGLTWQQIVTLDIVEYCEILLGEEPNFSKHEWARREVFVD